MSKKPSVLDWSFYLRPHARERNQVFRWLAGMLQRSYPLPDSLHALADANKTFRYPLRGMAVRVEEGESLGDLLVKEWSSCPRLLLELAKLGDRRGVLPQALAVGCELIDPPRPQGEKSRFILLGLYLAVVFTLALVMLATVLVFVAPTMAEMFSDMGRDLPQLTAWVVGISTFLAHHLGLSLVLAVVGLALVGLAIRGLRGAAWLERVPVLGRLVMYSRWWRICRGVGKLMEAGVALDEALAALGRGMGYRGLTAAAARIGARLKEGMTPAEAVAKEAKPPGQLEWAVSLAQATGDLPGALIRIGEMDRELETALWNKIAPALEIVSIVAMISILGLVVVAMYLPILSLAAEV